MESVDCYERQTIDPLQQNCYSVKAGRKTYTKYLYKISIFHNFFFLFVLFHCYLGLLFVWYKNVKNFFLEKNFGSGIFLKNFKWNFTFNYLKLIQNFNSFKLFLYQENYTHSLNLHISLPQTKSVHKTHTFVNVGRKLRLSDPQKI